MLINFLGFQGGHLFRRWAAINQINMVLNGLFFIFLTFCFDRNELIPKLKEYNTFFEGRKALQLTSKEVRMALEILQTEIKVRTIK